jgi:hypothetical protein
MLTIVVLYRVMRVMYGSMWHSSRSARMRLRLFCRTPWTSCEIVEHSSRSSSLNDGIPHVCHMPRVNKAMGCLSLPTIRGKLIVGSERHPIALFTLGMWVANAISGLCKYSSICCVKTGEPRKAPHEKGRQFGSDLIAAIGHWSRCHM